MTTTDRMWRTRYYEDMSRIARALGLDPHSIPEDDGPERILAALEQVEADRDMWRGAREDALDRMERAEDNAAAINADRKRAEARIQAVRDVLGSAILRVGSGERELANRIQHALNGGS